MRALKTLLIILLTVAVIFVILGLVGPKRSQVQRTTMIAAPPALVWDQVNTLKKQNDWSPFLAMDPGMQVTYEGADGEIGSRSSWKGEQTGTGEQTVSAVDPGRAIEVDLHFIEPFEGLAKGRIAVDPLQDSTKVTWTYDGENGFISRVISVFKDMDAMMGPVFADGLAKLKALAEANAAGLVAERKARTFLGYTIETVDRPAVTYLGKRQTVKWTQLDALFNATFPAVAQAATKSGMAITGHPSALVFKWDTVAHHADLFAGIPVQADTAASMDGLLLQTVAAGRALMVPYHGNYDQSEKAHNALGEMMKAHGLELRDAVIEEYVTDPTTEPDTAKWLTNIYYPIK
ncbi:MAG: SRPBCC family protein [Flavobacteriales bacterium]|nr:SRPBCC family protein [Flavobacteriales bacterium]